MKFPPVQRVARTRWWFAASMILAAVVAAPLGYAISGVEGIYCVLIAAGVCGLAGFAALVSHEVFCAPHLVLFQVTAGLFLRMGVPLAVCIVVYLAKGPLVEAGFAVYLLAFYFLALVLNAALALAARTPPAG